MKIKNVLRIVFALVLLSVLATVLIGCGKVKGIKRSMISFDKKYYFETNDDKTESYIVIHKDGTGEYDYYLEYDSGKVCHYNIQFKWTAADENTIIALSNGTKYYDHDTYSDKSKGKTLLLTIGTTKECLVVTSTSNINYFICEDFLEEIPNYDKVIN